MEIANCKLKEKVLFPQFDQRITRGGPKALALLSWAFLQPKDK